MCDHALKIMPPCKSKHFAVKLTKALEILLLQVTTSMNCQVLTCSCLKIRSFHGVEYPDWCYGFTFGQHGTDM